MFVFVNELAAGCFFVVVNHKHLLQIFIYIMGLAYAKFVES